MHHPGRSRVPFVITCAALAVAAVTVFAILQIRGDRADREVRKRIGSITTQAVVQFENDVAATTRPKAKPTTQAATTTRPAP